MREKSGVNVSSNDGSAKRGKTQVIWKRPSRVTNPRGIYSCQFVANSFSLFLFGCVPRKEERANKENGVCFALQPAMLAKVCQPASRARRGSLISANERTNERTCTTGRKEGGERECESTLFPVRYLQEDRGMHIHRCAHSRCSFPSSHAGDCS